MTLPADPSTHRSANLKEADVTMTEIVQRPESRTLDARDRCGAQAYVAVTLAGGDLLSCGHHYRANAEALAKAAMWAASEFAALTDHATDAMVRPVTGASLVVNRLSRFVVDPECFAQRAEQC